MSTKKEAVALVVVTFLVIILIYSSVAKFDALARQKKPTSDITCNKKLDLKTGKWDGSSYQCCYWSVDSKGNAQDYFCADCSTAADGVSLACNDYVQVTKGTPPGGIVKVPSGNPTNALPPSNNTSTVPPESIFKMPPGTTNALPPSSLQEQRPPITCPDGSAPDTNGNCPTSNTNQQIAPAQNLAENNNPQQGHHHKNNNNPLLYHDAIVNNRTKIMQTKFQKMF